MSDLKVHATAILLGVFVVLAMQTLLGILLLMLNIRASQYENVLGVALCVVSLTYGIEMYRQTLQGRLISPIPIAVVMAAYLAYFSVSVVGGLL